MRNVFLLLAITALFSCKGVSDSAKLIPRDSLPELFDNYSKQWFEFNPVMATFFGFRGYDDLLPIDIGQDHRERFRKFLLEYADKLNRVDMNGITHQDSLNISLLKWNIGTSLEGMKFNDHLMPVNQFQSPHLFMAQLGSGQGPQPFNTVADHENWMKRAGKFPEWVDTAIANMKEGIRTGWVLPKVLVEKILPQLQGFADAPLEKNIFYMPVARLANDSSINEADKKALTDKYRVLVEQQLRPAFARLHRFMKDEYLPAARTTAGIGDIKGGREYYQYLARFYTTTRMTPDEIFDLGQREVTRIKAEMEKVKEQVGFKGDLKAFFKHVIENEPKLRPYSDREQVLAHFDSIQKRMKPALEKQFDLVPKSAFVVRRTEAYREASGSAEYMVGDLKTNRPGVFYVPIPDPKKYNIFQDEALFLHEAIPGHHYQLSLQQENTAMPVFRQLSYFGAYQEGWGLYAESLGRELGLYQDPYQYFGRLGAEMHRALRLVLDVGIHMKGWTREQAIAYSLENEAESEANVIAEVERYMVIPGQALSYKVGEQKILALKEKAKKEMGLRFDIRQFHNEVLRDGAVPLDILEEKIDKLIRN